jgi:translation initiation factor IF-3
VNERIRVPEVRLIDVDGGQLGVVSTYDALRRAREQGLDLVEVAPTARPPVCRVMDFGKFLYQQKKRAAEGKKKQKATQLKEVKFRPNIDDHDYAFKLRNVLRFLGEGDKVKTTVQLRGREIGRPELGRRIIERVTGDVGDRGILESAPEQNGNRLHAVIAPSKHGPAKKVEKAEGAGAEAAGAAAGPAGAS